MARVYVGTYGKYNNGSIAGGWLDLADYKTYDEFLTACYKLHKNEKDPELMIQDIEDFPDGLGCMEWLSREDFNDVKQAMNENKPSVVITEYSEKSFIVKGDTLPIKEDLKALGGIWFRKETGWLFSNKKREAVEKYLSNGEVKREEKTTNQFVEWLNEFLETEKNDYYRKSSVGAIKLHGKYYLIEKPSIENKFCFHDEGPDYEFYKDLMKDKENRLASYFKSENLAVFDNKIEHIEKGEEWSNDRSVYWSDKCYTNNRLALYFYDGASMNDSTECTEEEKQLILQGLQYGRSLFEKRLDAYLKKYGTSKLHTWTYWADA